MANANEKTKPQSDTKSSPSETTAKTDTAASPSETLAGARAKRAEAMKVDKGPAKGAEKAPAVPKFNPDTETRARLFKMSDAELLAAAGDKLRPVDKANLDIYQATGNQTDHINGQDLSRSPIRAEVVLFLNSRKDQSAPANVIMSYMHLAAGKTYKGQFNFGYLTTKDGDNGKRGMVARKFLRLKEKAAPVEPATGTEG